MYLPPPPAPPTPPLSDPHCLMSERKLKLSAGPIIFLLNQHLIQAGDIIFYVLNEMETQ